ncbi:MAG TPA: GWxTD domain-containing protein [Gemmatimonadaceae bacterium]|nr:GWxTD domain-containing protein [Gemmatimonadaceae bacterium]
MAKQCGRGRNGAAFSTAAMVLVVFGGACASGRQPSAPAGAPDAPTARAVDRLVPHPPADAATIYQRMGLLAQGGALPFVGRVSHVAGPTPDTTLTLVSVSFPSRALTFTREGDIYRGGYVVGAELLRGPVAATRIEAPEDVVVPTFRETTRSDESVIFQEVLRAAPGTYDLVLTVRDKGSTRQASERRTITIPRLEPGSLATPIPFYEAVLRRDRDSLPRVLASPRATVTFGRDSVVPVYVEAYGAGDTLPLRVRAIGERGLELWRDSVTLTRQGELFSGVVNLPVSPLGIGMVTLQAWLPPRRDTSTTPVFVSFGESLPVATFDDMLDYLRLYAPSRLETLRRAPSAERATAWATFLRETDPDPTTSEHEGLQRYFGRIDIANQRFRDDGSPGWLSDRGMVFVAFGDPEQVYEPNPLSTQMRNRVQIWIYREHQLQLEFRDQAGSGRWRLTTQSEGSFRAALHRLRG